MTTSAAGVMVLADTLRLVRPAAQLLLIEASAIRPVLEDLDPIDLDKPTVCTGWSVRDVLGHCGAVGLGEWMHGGDVREAIGAQHPYTSEGAGLALGLLLERSAGRHRPHGQTSRRAVADKPVLDILVDGEAHRFGGGGGSVGALTTDLETFVRLCGGQRPDPERYDLAGAAASDLVLFG